MKGISCCADCANYNMKHHKCVICTDEGKPTDKFYKDCPLPDVELKGKNIKPIEKQETYKNIGVELKPCPFCGSKNVEVFKPVNEGNVGRAIICNDCDMRVGFPMAFDEIHAAMFWNKRKG